MLQTSPLSFLLAWLTTACLLVATEQATNTQITSHTPGPPSATRPAQSKVQANYSEVDMFLVRLNETHNKHWVKGQLQLQS